MAGNEQTVFHLVHPIASVGGEPIVRDEKERFFALAHNVREQFKRTLRVVRVEISVGSSARITCGSFASARAIATHVVVRRRKDDGWAGAELAPVTRIFFMRMGAVPKDTVCRGGVVGKSKSRSSATTRT